MTVSSWVQGSGCGLFAGAGAGAGDGDGDGDGDKLAISLKEFGFRYWEGMSIGVIGLVSGTGWWWWFGGWGNGWRIRFGGWAVVGHVGSLRNLNGLFLKKNPF